MAIGSNLLRHNFPREGIFYSLSFFICFLCLFLFQTKVVSTGDAGELIGAAFGLGIAHPSGYPVYLIISKALTFLPFGNIPLKVTLASSLSGALLIVLGMKFLSQTKSSYQAQLFFMFILIGSYSFFGQSIIAKFYPLNTVLILLIFFLGYKLTISFDPRHQMFIFFLLGLAAGLHHTAFSMLIPLAFVFGMNFKNFLKFIIPSVLFFFIGFINVIYLIIRSWKSTLINLSPSPDLQSLIYTLLRKAYGNSSSIAAAKSILLFDPVKIFYTLKNILLLLNKEFFWYSWLFFVLGFIFIYKKNKKFLIYLILCVFSYSLLLGYLTLSSKKPDINTWYICAHQYYLPLFFFYALLCGFGFNFITTKLPLKIEKISYLLLILPLIFFPQNFFINFYDRNQVAYYKTIDQLFPKPIKSIVIYTGDNDVFQAWYEKNVEKFRDDICILSAPKIKDQSWGVNIGCNEKIYKNFYPQIFKETLRLNLATLKGYMKNKRVWSSWPIEDNELLKKHLTSYYTLLDFVIFPNEFKPKFKDELSKWSKKLRSEYIDFLHYDACLNHGTDDVFTKALCGKYSIFLSFMAKDIGDQKVSSNIGKVDIIFTSKYKITLNINITKENLKILNLSYKIKKLNKTEEFYLYNGF